jgi:hypothetical protein
MVRLFDYRVAELILDTWCLSSDRQPSFRRAYMKFKMAIYAMAIVDYAPDGVMTAEVKARAWEEVQLTCTGRGEACTAGLLGQVWFSCREDERAALRRVFETAFTLAEDHTPKDAERLYPKKQRTAPFAWLSDTPPNLDPFAPYRGPRLIDACLEQGWNIDRALAAFAGLLDEENSPPKLTLLDGGSDVDT